MWKKKTTIAALSTLLLAAALPASIDAAITKKNVQAIYNDIKIRYNGAFVQPQVEPFIIDGTTYLPLRAIANMFNKSVDWDASTYTVIINDLPDSRIATLEAQLANKDAQIKSLEQQLQTARNRISTLENEKSKKSSKDDIDDLEDDLNDDYEDYFDDIELTIRLDGDEDKIEVEVRVDLEKYGDEWDELDEDDIAAFVKKLVKAIWKEFDDADVDGYIYDIDSKKKLHKFKGDADKERITLDGDKI